MRQEPWRWTLGSGSNPVRRGPRLALVERTNLLDPDADHARHARDALTQGFEKAPRLNLTMKAYQTTGHFDLEAAAPAGVDLMDDPDDLSTDQLVAAEEHLQQLRPTDDSNSPVLRADHRQPLDLVLEHQARRVGRRGG